MSPCSWPFSLVDRASFPRLSLRRASIPPRIASPPVLRRSFLARNLWYREIIPDPRGLVSLALALGLLLSHLSLTPGPATFLWSQNPFLEVLGHIWFILGPPLSLFLGLRHLVVSGDSSLP